MQFRLRLNYPKKTTLNFKTKQNWERDEIKHDMMKIYKTYYEVHKII